MIDCRGLIVVPDGVGKGRDLFTLEGISYIWMIEGFLFFFMIAGVGEGRKTSGEWIGDLTFDLLHGRHMIKRDHMDPTWSDIFREK